MEIDREWVWEEPAGAGPPGRMKGQLDTVPLCLPI